MSIDALEDYVGPTDAALRLKLLAGARTGDPKATAELWQRYRMRLIPVATPMTEAYPDAGKKRKQPWIAGPWRGFKKA